MKKILIIALAFMIFLPSVALADGGLIMPPDMNEKISLPEQKAVIIWEDGEETLILSTKIQPEEITDIAWIVPIQSVDKPEVDKGNISLFFDVARLFRSTDRGYFGGAMEATAQAGEVQIFEVKRIDMYFLATIKATDASVLLDWLNTRGFYFPPE